MSGADALEDHWLGRRVTAAGRGLTETDERVVTEPISGLTEAAITIDGAGRGGACFGDSGGPLLARDAEGSIRIA